MQTVYNFACGLAAGWSQILIGQPFDIIKTKAQLSSTRLSIQYLKNTVKDIVSDYGLLGFYRGSSSLFFGFGIIIGLQFTIYEGCKRYLTRTQYHGHESIPEQLLSIGEIWLSGAVVGSSVSLVYCPVQYTKIARQTNKNLKKGSLRILLQEVYKGNIRKIYQGYIACLLRDTLGGAVYYSAYQATVRLMCKVQNQSRSFAGVKQFLAGGALAGLSYWTIIYPLDVIKTKRQKGESYHIIMQSIKRNSFNGYGLMAMRSILVNSVSFATFEYMKAIFKIFDLLLAF